MLALSQIAGHLLERGLLDPEAVLDGQLVIVDLSSRNQNCAVSASGRDGLFLKQASRGADEGAGRAFGAAEPSLAHEAAVYALLGSLPPRGPGCTIHTLLPRCHGYDTEHGLLTLELLEGSRDLTSHHLRTGRFSSEVARRIGAGLGDLHARGLPAVSGQSEQFTGRLPWVLGLDRPGTGLWREASNAGLELVQILQATPDMRHALSRLRGDWQVDAFVHHDIKWDNCLVVPDGRSPRHLRLALVDWEFADLGDACWDAGSVLSNYLSHWLASIPVTGAEPPDRYLELARYPLTSMQPALRAFWLAYVRARQWNSAAADRALLRCVRYAGARLLQSAYERTVHLTRLDGTAVCLLQLSLNVMLRPREAAHHLLGINEGGAPW
jgi:hypothetical protein